MSSRPSSAINHLLRHRSLNEVQVRARDAGQLTLRYAPRNTERLYPQQ